MHYSKPALTYEQQLELLKSRGLLMPDEARALHWLRRKGYFRLSAYFLPFKVRENGLATNQFTPETTFDQIIQLYKFDADLRCLVIEAIERVEVALRASITYHFAHALGPYGYNDRGNFTPYVPSSHDVSEQGFNHAYFMKRVESERSQSKEEFVRHFNTVYTAESDLPIWMLTEIVSFGTLSKMTEGVQKKLRKQIARDFNISQSQLVSWLESLTYIRNLCAHHSRLWNRELSLKPELLREWKTNWGVKNNRMYCIFLVLEHILNHASPRAKWKDFLFNLILDNPQIDLHAMAFPHRWKESLPWNVSQPNICSAYRTAIDHCLLSNHTRPNGPTFPRLR